MTDAIELKHYIGTMLISAAPMTRAAYNDLRGWEVPEDEDGDDEGYLIELSGEKPNHQLFEGHIQWLTKEIFENRYRQDGDLSFGDALVLLRAGFRMSRRGWNGVIHGQDMWIMFVPGTEDVETTEGTAYHSAGVMKTNIRPHIDMRTADGDMQPGWLPSQMDILTDDWFIVGQ